MRSVNVQRLIVVVVVVFVVFYVITQPTQSANAVHTILGWLKNGADALITFIRGLFA
jgi:hypothetical protein